MPAFISEIRRTRHRTTGCFLAASLALALAACGSRSTSDEMLLEDALDTTFDDVDSVTSTLRTLTDGTTVTRRALVDGDPECHMHISKGQLTMDLLVSDAGHYSRGSEEAFRWAASEGIAVTPEQIETVADRWVQRGGQVEADLMREAVCDPKVARSALEEQLLAPENLGQVEKESGTVNGRETAKLTFTGGPSTVEAHIAAEGRPYLLKVVERGGDVWTFGDFDKPFRAKTPAESIDEDEIPGEIVDPLV
ncbi:hypothetical protein [Streptomyces sp. 184]|uniref:hypothetical protein n=1 Tax=Streptomyces sp. 184 TaxID=1827526 RepID=UPI0038926450